MPRGVRIAHYLNDHVAQLRSGRDHALLFSTLPLRTRAAGAGASKPVALDLIRHGQTFEPQRPLVPTSLGARLGTGLSLRGLITAVRAAAAGRDGDTAQRLGQYRLFFPEIARDTDFAGEANTLGFEAYWQLRGPDSPSELVLHNRLARGVTLRQVGPAIQIVKSGREVARILPPRAFDAAGQRVAVDQMLVGSDLELFVDHRRSDVRYPVLVDPSYTGEDWYHPGTPTWHHGNPDGLEAWQSYSNNSGITVGNVCNVSVNCFDGNNLGLFLQAQPGYYYDGSGAFWQFLGQGQGDSTYISELQGAFLVATSKGVTPTASAYLQILNTSGTVISQTDVMNTTGNPYITAGQGTVARFALRMNGSSTRAVWNSFDVGGALVVMHENSAPSLQSASLGWDQSTWYPGAEPLTPTITMANTGFGVEENEAIYYTATGTRVGIPIDTGCDGHYETRCNYTLTTPFSIPVDSMREGVNYVQFGGYSPSGNGSDANGNKFAYRIDRSAPRTLALSGSLYDHRNGTIGAGTYSLQAYAEDWGNDLASGDPYACSDTSDAAQRSGIATVAVELDGKSLATSPTQSTGTGCYTYPLQIDTSSWALGPHEVRVTATDHMGLVKTEAFTVTIAVDVGPTAPPAITGSTRPGETLTASPGEWSSAAPLTYAYQWERCSQTGADCTDLPGETSQTYTVETDDTDATLAVRVVATDGVSSATQESARTGIVETLAPAFSDDPSADDAITSVAPYVFRTTCSADSDSDAPVAGGDCSESDDSNTATAAASAETAASTSGVSQAGWGIADDVGGATEEYDLFGMSATDAAWLRTDKNVQDVEVRSADPRATALKVSQVRLIVPWDIMIAPGYATCGQTCGTNPNDSVEVSDQEHADAVAQLHAAYRWLTAANSAGKSILVSFDQSHVKQHYLPSRTEYRDATNGFRQEFQYVRWYTAWNEPDRSDQPTAISGTDYTGPHMAGKYWRDLNWQCRDVAPVCTVAAGDFLDASIRLNDTTYFDQYTSDAGIGRVPRIWAWHAYQAGVQAGEGKTPQTNKGFLKLKAFLDGLGSGTIVWLTEQGGLQCQVIHSGTTNTPYNYGLSQAETGLDFLLNQMWGQMTSAERTKITRFYLYQWRGGHTHDSGLVDWANNNPNTNTRRMYAMYLAKTNPSATPPNNYDTNAPACG